MDWRLDEEEWEPWIGCEWAVVEFTEIQQCGD